MDHVLQGNDLPFHLHHEGAEGRSTLGASVPAPGTALDPGSHLETIDGLLHTVVDVASLCLREAGGEGRVALLLDASTIDPRLGKDRSLDRDRHEGVGFDRGHVLAEAGLAGLAHAADSAVAGCFLTVRQAILVVVDAVRAIARALGLRSGNCLADEARVADEPFLAVPAGTTTAVGAALEAVADRNTGLHDADADLTDEASAAVSVLEALGNEAGRVEEAVGIRAVDETVGVAVVVVRAIQLDLSADAVTVVFAGPAVTGGVTAPQQVCRELGILVDSAVRVVHARRRASRDRGADAARCRITRVGGAGIAVVADHVLVDATRCRVARVGGASAAVVAGSLVVDTAGKGVARVHGARIEVVAVGGVSAHARAVHAGVIHGAGAPVVAVRGVVGEDALSRRGIARVVGADVAVVARDRLHGGTRVHVLVAGVGGAGIAVVAGRDGAHADAVRAGVPAEAVHAVVARGGVVGENALSRRGIARVVGADVVVVTDHIRAEVTALVDHAVAVVVHAVAVLDCGVVSGTGRGDAGRTQRSRLGTSGERRGASRGVVGLVVVAVAEVQRELGLLDALVLVALGALAELLRAHAEDVVAIVVQNGEVEVALSTGLRHATRQEHDRERHDRRQHAGHDVGLLHWSLLRCGVTT